MVTEPGLPRTSTSQTALSPPQDTVIVVLPTAFAAILPEASIVAAASLVPEMVTASLPEQMMEILLLSPAPSVT